MLYLILAMLSSAAMALVLKWFRGQRGNRYGILLGNYVTCVLIAWLMLPQKSAVLGGSSATLICGGAGGLLFVAALVCMQTSIRRSGATLTTAFARLGLLVTLGVSILIFRESPAPVQLAGIGLALCALLLLRDKNTGSAGSRTAAGFGLLLLTMLTGGGGDAMAKIFEQIGPEAESRLYFFYLFATALVLCGGLLLWERRKTGKHILPGELAAGILVGIPNYFSSYLLLRALQSLPASLAYPTYSAGTILLVLLLSALLFRERLSGKQIPGILLILTALVLLNL